MEYNLINLDFVYIASWINQNPFHLLKSVLKMALLLRFLFDLEGQFVKLSNLM